MMNLFVLTIFLLVYAGMILGEIPGLALDRSGIALLGAIAIVAGGRLSPNEAWLAIDVPTIALLFGLMVISAQFRLGGFYSEVLLPLPPPAAGPERLLAAVIATSGILSALLTNDVVCLAMAPMLVEASVRRGLAPLPYLLALACASNIGSAATLIGNPQIMLIGQRLQLSFAGYLMDGGPPAVLGLAATWTIIRWQWRGRWQQQTSVQLDRRRPPAFDRWQTGKGLALLTLALVAFVGAPWPREVVALSVAGVLLLSRRMASREMLGLVDWHLLVLFVGLFVLNEATDRAGLLTVLYDGLRGAGVDLANMVWLFVMAPPLANLVSNVPAVMLLLPAVTGPLAGATLALASTLAGNMLVVGSIANIIVVEQASRQGLSIDWRDHARTGVPVTLATLAIAAAWLWIRSG